MQPRSNYFFWKSYTLGCVLLDHCPPLQQGWKKSPRERKTPPKALHLTQCRVVAVSTRSAKTEDGSRRRVFPRLFPRPIDACTLGNDGKEGGERKKNTITKRFATITLPISVAFNVRWTTREEQHTKNGFEKKVLYKHEAKHSTQHLHHGRGWFLSFRGY